MPVLASCDDEPPEPLIDRPRDHFGYITLVEAGIALRVSPLRSTTARTNPSKRGVKARALRPLRSFVLLATLLDEGHALQSFASLWRSSVRSLQYKQPYWEISRAVRVIGDLKPLAASPLCSLAPSAVLSKSCLTPEISSDGVIDSSPGEWSFSIPRIVVIPPSEEDLALSLNQVPTPQDAGYGNLLTVPDPELEAINQSGLPRTLFDSPYFRRERLYSFPGACKEIGIPPVLAKESTVVTCLARISTLETLGEEEDEVLDLGPTWSG